MPKKVKTTKIVPSSVALGITEGPQIDWVFWEGEVLEGPVVAFDTETTIVDLDREVPQLVLMTAWTGTGPVRVIAPHQVWEFIELHCNKEWVGHNTAFDFWVIERHTTTMRDLWWDMMDRGQFHDTYLLDLLLRLSEVQEKDAFLGKGLAELAEKFCGLHLTKDNPYRMTFEDIVGEDWTQVDQGYFQYAAEDAHATFKVYWELCKSITTSSEAGSSHADNETKWGLLGERIQVWASVALSDITRRGICVDQQNVVALAGEIRTELETLVGSIHQAHPGVLCTYKVGPKKGKFKLTKGSHVPRLNLGAVRSVLLGVAKELHITKLPTTTRTNQVVTALAVWQSLAEEDPFVASWSRMMELNKLLQFVIKLEGHDRVHPKYRVLVRTGRTSCTGPNIQQIPRNERFRRLFRAGAETEVPRLGLRPNVPGQLAAVDYSFIELRTLAAVCLNRFGESRLAEVIKEGRDPHEHTAAMLVGESPYAFHRLKELDPHTYKAKRQGAKAVNFGVPGGLGPTKLAKYAKTNYGVDLTEQEAKDFRKKLITEIYPELALYLAQDSATILAHNLCCSTEEVRREFGEDWALFAVEKVVSGRAVKKDGTPYNRSYCERIWQGLEALSNCDDPKVVEGLSERKAGEFLRAKLFSQPVSTLTGRVRGGSTYAAARNTPFQGLAADGAKVALYRLMRLGYRTVAFIHDEILVEISEESEAEQVSKVMCECMGEVLRCDLPVACEWNVGTHWTKG